RDGRPLALARPGQVRVRRRRVRHLPAGHDPGGARAGGREPRAAPAARARAVRVPELAHHARPRRPRRPRRGVRVRAHDRVRRRVDGGRGATPKRLRVALTQWHATADVAANLALACGIVREAAPERPDLVLLPENGLCLGTNAEMRARALEAAGPELAALGAAARAADAVVVLGGFKRRVAGDALVRNTAAVFDRDGRLAACYDKIHLFDASVGGMTFAASSVERAGDRPLLVEIAGATVGVTICYDVRFPELYRTLALAGAEVLLVPSAFTFVTGTAHWEVLLRARAIENGAFVVASATVRGEGDAFETFGHALVVGPWGDVRADLGDAPRAWTVVELDLDEVAAARRRL